MTDHGHYGIEILKDGTWLYQGTPIARHNLVKLFASVLKRDENGVFWLQTPAERGRITVEDAPFVAVAMAASGAGAAQVLRFTTNTDDTVTAGAAHGLRFAAAGDNGEVAPYIMVRDGLEARLSRPVYYSLMALAAERAAGTGDYGVWSGGVFFPVAQMPPAGRQRKHTQDT